MLVTRKSSRSKDRTQVSPNRRMYLRNDLIFESTKKENGYICNLR
jgi:hypothetical protein